MNFEEAMIYLDQVSSFGSVLGLETTRELLARLDDPQDKLKFIHIAGTNGKGSTAAYLANILSKAGYKVGRYISPTILEYCERIQITCDTTRYIEKETVARHITRIASVIKEMLEQGLSHPTPFEIETAMAFLEFVEQKCDIVVLEVGLGGRLDSTNVIQTTVCAVITSISMDHMSILGDTLGKIAYEKAGIIKYGVPVVSYQQDAEAAKVIEQVCEQQKANLTVVNFHQIENAVYEVAGSTFDYQVYQALRIQLLGEIQIRNAVVAVETIGVLNKLGYKISEQSIREGLIETRWKGRFEVIHEKPFVIIDGAHNEDAAIALNNSLNIYFPGRKMVYVMGVLADKEYSKVLYNTANHAKRIITVTPNNMRALSSADLAQHAKQYCEDVIDAGTVNNGLNIAMNGIEEDDIILIFGSLSFLDEVYHYFS
jgi:dihydrofolate synthase/folylpolyglutamate synthase